MGETRDRLMDQAKEVGKEKVEQAKEVGECRGRPHRKERSQIRSWKGRVGQRRKQAQTPQPRQNRMSCRSHPREIAVAHARHPDDHWGRPRPRSTRAAGHPCGRLARHPLAREGQDLAGQPVDHRRGCGVLCAARHLSWLIALVGVYGMIFDPQQVGEHLSMPDRGASRRGGQPDRRSARRGHDMEKLRSASARSRQFCLRYGAPRQACARS